MGLARRPRRTHAPALSSSQETAPSGPLSTLGLVTRLLLFSFYHFPAEHWAHLRTTNPIESTFATVRLRTQRTKGCGSRLATLTMVYKLGLEAQKTWRRLNGAEKLTKVISGTPFVDGIEATENQEAA